MIHELGSFVTRAPRSQEREGGIYSLIYTLQGTNISHLGKRKIIFKHTWGGDMLVSRRVTFGGLIPTLTLEVNQTGADFLKKGHNFNTTPSEEIHITFIFHCHGTTSSKPFLLRILYPSSFCTWQNLELKQPTKHIPTNKKNKPFYKPPKQHELMGPNVKCFRDFFISFPEKLEHHSSLKLYDINPIMRQLSFSAAFHV